MLYFDFILAELQLVDEVDEADSIGYVLSEGILWELFRVLHGFVVKEGFLELLVVFWYFCEFLDECFSFFYGFLQVFWSQVAVKTICVEELLC